MIMLPSINMTATGNNITQLLRCAGMTVQDLQNIARSQLNKCLGNLLF